MRGMSRFGGICLAILLAAGGWNSQSMSVQASAARVSLQASADQLVVGDFFYIVITVSADEEMSGFEGYFSYDQSVMRFVTGGSVSSGNDDEIHIKDTGRETGDTKLKYSIRCQARRAGSSVIALKEPYAVYAAEDGEEMSVGSGSIELEVISKKKAAKLKRLQEQAESSASPVPSGELPGDQRAQAVPSGEISSDMPRGTADIASPEPAAGDEHSMDGVDVLLPEETAEEAQETPASTEFAEASGTGLTRNTCIVILCLAVAGLVMIAILSAGIWRRARDEEDWSEEEWETSLEEEAPGEENGELQEQEQNTDTKFEEETESIEEIERRLEEKRQWLRKE